MKTLTLQDSMESDIIVLQYDSEVSITVRQQGLR